MLNTRDRVLFIYNKGGFNTKIKPGKKRRSKLHVTRHYLLMRLGKMSRSVIQEFYDLVENGSIF